MKTRPTAGAWVKIRKSHCDCKQLGECCLTDISVSRGSGKTVAARP